MWRNDKIGWGAAAKLFHWTIALLILIEVPAGFIMSRTYGAKSGPNVLWQYWTSNYHHTAGLIVLLLALARLIWRSANPVPQPAAVRPRFERWLGHATHLLLYALLLLIPLSGWASLSALADSASYGKTYLWFFGTNGFDNVIPRIVPPRAFNDPSPFTYGLFARGHRWLLIAGAVLLTLHILAALRHHFLLKDGTLRRMLPGALR